MKDAALSLKTYRYVDLKDLERLGSFLAPRTVSEFRGLIANIFKHSSFGGWCFVTFY